MAQGMRLPARVKAGRFEKLSGDAYISQIIMTALAGHDSSNPFQDIGLGDWMIFELNDKLTITEIRTRLELIFVSLAADQLATLESPQKDIRLSRNSEGELHCDLTYNNMETQERVSLSFPIQSSGD
jgi:hypothetical protein